MQYQIVPMDKSHLTQVANLEKLSFSRPWSEAQLEESLYLDNNSFLVAETKQGLVLGYAGLSVVMDEGYLNNIAVFPKYQNTGVAGEILDVFCAYGKENLAFITLEVRPSNENARALYRRRNFTEVGVRKDYYTDPKEDALILSLNFR